MASENEHRPFHYVPLIPLAILVLSLLSTLVGSLGARLDPRWLLWGGPVLLVAFGVWFAVRELRDLQSARQQRISKALKTASENEPQPYYYARLIPLAILVLCLFSTLLGALGIRLDPHAHWRPFVVPVLLIAFVIWFAVRKLRDPQFAREQRIARDNYYNSPPERWRRAGLKFMLSAIGIYLVTAIILYQLGFDVETLGLLGMGIGPLAAVGYIIWTGVRAIWNR